MVVTAGSTPPRRRDELVQVHSRTLAATKASFNELRSIRKRNAAAPPAALKAACEALRLANADIVRLSRDLQSSKQQSATERAVFKSELRAELVAREAHAARTADRYRIAIERRRAVGDLDRAAVSAAQVEAAFLEIAPCTSVSTLGSRQLYHNTLNV